MNDFLLEIARRPAARFVYRRLPVPMDLPPVLERTTVPWAAEPLAGKSVRLGTVAGSNLTETLRPLLEKAGARIEIAGAANILILDATAAQQPEQLDEVFAFLQAAILQLKPSGRVIVVGSRGDQLADSLAAATQEALVGFVRSLAKELGRRGATAHAVLLPLEGPEASAPLLSRLAGPLLFLASPRAAYVSGQILRLSADIAPPETLAFPETAPLAGKKALVTGAARGIGAVIAAFLAREGAVVLGVDHPSQKEALEKTMGALNGRALVADLAEEASLLRIEKEIAGHGGTLDVLINNAGITRDKTLAKMTQEQWSSVLRVNLDAPAKLTRVLVDSGLLAKDGRVVFMSSVVGISGNFGQTNYSAAKAGLLGFVAHEAPRLAERGITVNAIAPGFIDTPMTKKMPFLTRELARRTCSLKQGGLPEDVAQAATFFSSPGSF